jgi:Cys-tRNA(Pro) deacylase
MQPMTPDDFKAAAVARGLEINVRTFTEPTATSQQAADQIGCQLGQIVKSLAFFVDEHPILVLASGDGRVDEKKLAALYNVGRKKVKAAKPEQLVAVWGYPPGGVPPFGHRTANLPTYIDESLARFEVVYAAGGSHNTIFEIPFKQLVTVTGGQMLDVRKA